MNCCAARQANSSLSFVGGGGVSGGSRGGTEVRGGAAMSKSRMGEDKHKCVGRCYKEGMVISTTGEAPLILT